MPPAKSPSMQGGCASRHGVLAVVVLLAVSGATGAAVWRTRQAVSLDDGPRPVPSTASLRKMVETSSQNAPTADPPQRAPSPYMEAALGAARWIRAHEVRTEHGVTWPVCPDQNPESSTSLYAGSAGVILFFIEMHRATGDESLLRDARRGADELIASLPGAPAERGAPAAGGAPPPAILAGEQAGLYTGVAGVGFALDQVYQATGEARYRQGAMRCVELLHAAAKPAGGGVEWTDCTDIISGSSGTGLFLLYAARHMDRPATLELARQTGRRLLELAQVEPGGRWWRMDPRFARVMPNFSHGTAGVAYYLACLHEATGDREFLDAALDGARYLTSIARTEGGGCLIRHHGGDGENLFYLGWCHGPAGTGRLFYKLGRITGDAQWQAWMKRCGEALAASGIPAKRTDGFWNNVGQCCGSAGVAEFLLDLDAAAADPRYRTRARSLLDDVCSRATAEGDGRKWIQAEHRIKPDLLQAQVGFAQGAAGIGLAMLHMDAALTGRQQRLRLPDSPF